MIEPRPPVPFTRSVLRNIIDTAPYVSAIVIAQRLNWSGAQLRRVARAHGVALLDEASLDAMPAPVAKPRAKRDDNDAPGKPGRRGDRGANLVMIGINVPSSLADALRKRATAKGVSLSAFLRDVLRQTCGLER